MILGDFQVKDEPNDIDIDEHPPLALNLDPLPAPVQAGPDYDFDKDVVYPSPATLDTKHLSDHESNTNTDPLADPSPSDYDDNGNEDGIDPLQPDFEPPLQPEHLVNHPPHPQPQDVHMEEEDEPLGPSPCHCGI